jgi:DNA mismatch endonuclease (patch repair protein)
MAAIRSTDTRPEMVVRRMVHSMGFRYRLHVRGLPGTPDLVFRARKKVIFVHGCFWHMHSCPRGQLKPTTNSAFWSEKRMRNVRRDRANNRRLRAAGWKVLIVWECAIKKEEKTEQHILRFLSESTSAD